MFPFLVKGNSLPLTRNVRRERMFLDTSISFFLPTIFYSIIIASSISQAPSTTPSLSIIQPTNLSSIQNDNMHCTDLLNPFSRRAKYPDCTLAIRQLPVFPASGAFHNQGPDDPFKLPVQRTVSSCTVRVELYAASSTVSASWPGISTRASTLNRLCLRRTFAIYKGGWATYAKDERILVTLAYPDRYSRRRSMISA